MNFEGDQSKCMEVSEIDNEKNKNAEVNMQENVVANIALADPSSTRSLIYNAIISGQVQEAMSLIIHHHPKIIEGAPFTCFRLMRMHFIELVCEKRVGDALKFARYHMSKLGQFSATVKRELERTMQILVFENAMLNQYTECFSLFNRTEVARMIDEMIVRTAPDVDELLGALDNMNIVMH